VQVGSAFAAAGVVAATLFIATAPARRSAQGSRSIAMQQRARDPRPGAGAVASAPADRGKAPQAVQKNLTASRETDTDGDIPEPEPESKPEPEPESELDAESEPKPESLADDDPSNGSKPPEVGSRGASPKKTAGTVGGSSPRSRPKKRQRDADVASDDAAGEKPSRAFTDLLETDGLDSTGGARRSSSPASGPGDEDPEPGSLGADDQQGSEDSPTARLPVPDEADVAKAAESINAVYAEELASREDYSQTISKLLAAARKSGKPASKYALMLAAERKALQVSAFRRACDVIDARAEVFEIDALQSRLNMLRDSSKSAGDAKNSIFDIAVEITEEAMEAGRYDLASKAAALASSMAASIEQNAQSKTGGGRVETAKQLRQTVADHKKLHQKYDQARETLRETPDDAKALEIVGKYLCFVKQDWKEGLAALAAGRESVLQDLAAREIALLAGSEPDTTAVFALAGEWWALAETVKRLGDLPAGSGDLVKIHAAESYKRVVDGLDDPIESELAKKRIAAAGSTGPGLSR
jgi:hypothetical protein